MSKAIMLSIQPKYCELIASGEKTIEVRKTRPKLEVPFKCYIYQTKKKWIYRLLKKLGLYQEKVIGEFVCDKVEMLFNTHGNPDNYMTEILPDILQRTALSYKEFQLYTNSRASKNNIYGWHITALKIYDKPKEFGEFRTPKNIHRIGNSHSWVLDGYKKITRPFQSWGYVELLED